MTARCPECGQPTWPAHQPTPGAIVLAKCERCKRNETKQEMAERKPEKRSEDHAA
jgi:hypothetical protein